jgi:hypothetical protein
MLGDSEFFKRYGVNFSVFDSSDSRKGVLGFTVDGRPAAKLCLKYKVEPIFEMLAYKLEENGVRCAVETYDPAINSAFVAYCRGDSDNPINVVHKNANDFYAAEEPKADDMTGAVACSSRLKLVEIAVWCKRTVRILRISSILQLFISCISIAVMTTALAFGFVSYINQYHVLVWQVLAILPVFALMMINFPKRDYFNT